MAQRLDRIELCSRARGIETEDDADRAGDPEREQDRPDGDDRLHGGELRDNQGCEHADEHADQSTPDREHDGLDEVATTQNDIEKRNAIATAQPELRRIRNEQNDKRAAADKARADAEAKAKAEREAMIKRLPEVLQARIMAGYAAEKQVSAALRQLALADANLTHDEYAESRELRVLTDDEFVALENARKLVAKGMPEASVMPVEVADKFGAWRKATEDDDLDDIDDDGDVWEEGVNVRRRIEVEWDVAGITVKAAMPFEAFAKGEPQTQSQTPEADSGIVG